MVIHHTFAPLGDRRQRMLALKLSYAPWAYKKGTAVESLRRTLEEKFHAKASLFSSGREGLLALLRNIRKGSTDEVILQGYTCVVLPNAIHAAGMKPVYVDIQKSTLNLDLDATRSAITANTRAIIVQHTFGIPGPVAELRRLCDEKKVLLIEDCAHMIPDAQGPDEVGMLGDAVLLSFGRDKAISGVAGGAMLTREPALTTHLKTEESRAKHLSFWTIAKLLEYPQIYALARCLYGVGLGKVILWKAKIFKWFIPILTEQEKEGKADTQLHKIPNVCAALALDQLRRLGKINDHRRMMTQFYLKVFAEHGWGVLHGIGGNLPLQKFPMFIASTASNNPERSRGVTGAEEIRRALKKKNIILEDGWSNCVICPSTVKLSETGYQSGTDKEAETVCEEILSLPTHPGTTVKDAERLVSALETTLR